MKAPQFHNLYRFALALLLAGAMLAARLTLPDQPAGNSLAASQTIPPASICTGSTCG